MFFPGDVVEWDTVVGPTRGTISGTEGGFYVITYGPWDDVTHCPIHQPEKMRLVRRAGQKTVGARHER